MVTEMIHFISFRLTDAIDILLVATILYLAYNLVKGTSAINIFVGLALIYFAYIVIKAFDLQLLSSIIGKFVNVGVIAVMIVFQQEIRKFLLYIGSNEFLRNKNWKGLFKFNATADESGIQLDIDALADACFNMSFTKTGALIIIARKSDLKFFIATGDVVDSGLTSRMLENIFIKTLPCTMEPLLFMITVSLRHAAFYPLPKKKISLHIMACDTAQPWALPKTPMHLRLL